MKTVFLGCRKPSRRELAITNCDLIFTREDVDTGETYDIYVNLPDGYYSWMQWGVDKNILGDNVDDLEEYIARHSEVY